MFFFILIPLSLIVLFAIGAGALAAGVLWAGGILVVFWLVANSAHPAIAGAAVFVLWLAALRIYAWWKKHGPEWWAARHPETQKALGYLMILLVVLCVPTTFVLLSAARNGWH